MTWFWNTLRNTSHRFMVSMLLISASLGIRADEGMWIPMLIEKYQLNHMQEAGLRLSAEEIYSINRDCLMDAIVIFGGGCTGEMISSEGLLLTNHHCGEGAIQSHSSVENDYWAHGFWAMSRVEELPSRGVRVTFLRYIEDVTTKIFEGIIPGMDPLERERIREENRGKIISDVTLGSHYKAEVKPFYYGNAYYLFVYEVFRDVRLVGAPPVAIGNFGADQDNWMWPRHTGDFTLFRVYADKENKPALYDPANKPYTPRKHLEIAAGGIKEGDFTMILGYPGSTTRYLHSEGVRSLLESGLPTKIGLRTTRLEIMDHYMSESDIVRFQYVTKYRGVSNAWKKWKGMMVGLNRNHVTAVKEEEEREFGRWVAADGERQLKYDRLLNEFTRIYKELEPYKKAEDLMNEGVMSVELFREASRLTGMMRRGLPAETLEARVETFFRSFHMPIDREIFGAMMEAYSAQIPNPFIPAFLNEITVKYKGSFERFAYDTYKKSLLSDKERLLKLIERYSNDPDRALKQMGKDPLYFCLNQFHELFMKQVIPNLHQLEDELETIYKEYMASLTEMNRENMLYPDANLTMRLTYGKVDGYNPGDGVQYHYATRLSGVIEKAREDYEDYRIPPKLEQLYHNKEYGKYGENGTMPVCFIASNHTSGGNSGSPVLDAEGRLIGLNFDRNWEGTMSDIFYDPSLCRNIAVDIRYILFIVDKFAGAGYLLEEMDIYW